MSAISHTALVDRPAYICQLTLNTADPSDADANDTAVSGWLRRETLDLMLTSSNVQQGPMGSRTVVWRAA